MYTLILDSANVNIVVGLCKDNEVLDETIYEAWQRQSEYMIPEIDKILKKNGVDPKDIGEIIVTKGPGSYTGVRIALTIAKIYAMSLNIRCYAVSSLKVLQSYNKPSICLINARSNRSYFAVYDKNTAIIEDCVMSNGEVLKYIESHRDYDVCGDATYVDLVSFKNDIVKTMMLLKDDCDIVDNILSLKAVYLKD